jgi:hypothetical protein
MAYREIALSTSIRVPFRCSEDIPYHVIKAAEIFVGLIARAMAKSGEHFCGIDLQKVGTDRMRVGFYQAPGQYVRGYLFTTQELLESERFFRTENSFDAIPVGMGIGSNPLLHEAMLSHRVW